MGAATLWLLAVAGVLWLPFEASVVWRNRRIQAADAGGRATDLLLATALIGSAAAAAAVAVWGPTWRIPRGPWPQVAGLVLVFGGIGLRMWAVRTLGRFFSVQLTLQADQPLITAGPYRIVRHPSYTGIVVLGTGVGLSLSNVAVLLVVVVPLTVAYVVRIRAEERFMRRAFGQAYQDYASRTWGLIPYVW